MSALDPFVRAAREVRPSATGRVDVEVIARQAATARSRRRGQLIGGSALVAAVCAALWWGGEPRLESQPKAFVSENSPATPEVVPATAPAPTTQPGVADWSAPVRGPDVVGHRGAHTIARRGGAIATPAGTLWLDGEAEVEVASADVIVHLSSGVAAFDNGDRVVVLGHERFVQVRPEKDGPDEAAVSASATSLARRAESQLLAGNRRAARRTLATLVGEYPKAPEAKTALLDIATISRRLGDEGQAACALTAFVEQWSTDRQASAAQAQLERLPAATCRGLRPR